MLGVEPIHGLHQPQHGDLGQIVEWLTAVAESPGAL
jgi:hypothetical protein